MKLDNNQVDTYTIDAEKYLQNFEEIIEEVTKEGFEVIRSDPRHLLIDIDSYDSLICFEKMYPIFTKIYQDSACEYWFSKSGNYHFYITLPSDLLFEERIALQCSLGSDRLREFLSLKNLKYYSIPEASLLFKPKGSTSIKYQSSKNLLIWQNLIKQEIL